MYNLFIIVELSKTVFIIFIREHYRKSNTETLLCVATFESDVFLLLRFVAVGDVNIMTVSVSNVFMIKYETIVMYTDVHLGISTVQDTNRLPDIIVVDTYKIFRQSIRKLCASV